MTIERRFFNAMLLNDSEYIEKKSKEKGFCYFNIMQILKIRVFFSLMRLVEKVREKTFDTIGKVIYLYLARCDMKSINFIFKVIKRDYSNN